MKREKFWVFWLIGIICFGLLAETPLSAGGQKSASSKEVTIMYPKIPLFL
jgi:hypothetical protein